MKSKLGCVTLCVLLALPVYGQNGGQQIVLVSGEKYPDLSIDSLDGNDLIAVSADTMLRIPLDSIAVVSMPGSSNILRGISIGLLAGAAAGFMGGLIIDGANGKRGGSNPASGETDYKVILPIAAGILGGSIGAIAGSSGGVSHVNLIGKSVGEKRTILQSVIRKK